MSVILWKPPNNQQTCPFLYNHEIQWEVCEIVSLDITQTENECRILDRNIQIDEGRQTEERDRGESNRKKQKEKERTIISISISNSLSLDHNVPAYFHLYRQIEKQRERERERVQVKQTDRMRAGRG